MGCRPSTILPNTTRLSGMLLRGDVCLITFCFQTVWAFLTSSQLHSPPTEFTLFPSLSFSVRPVFSVLTGPRPKVVRLA